MKLRNLGKSGLQVSLIGLGCKNFGQRMDLESSRLVIHKALDAGITLFDTADVYGGRGGSETAMGQILGDRRKDIVLASKFGMPMDDGEKNGASRRYIMSAVEASLKRLKTDWIDLYQQHRPDPLTPIEETLRTLDDLVRAGKVLYVGCSNYAAYRLMRSLWMARNNHWAPFVTLQAQYSLLVRDLEREHVPLCRDEGLGILPWSPLAGGFLTGKYQRGSTPAPGTRAGSEKPLYQWVSGEYAASDRNWSTIDAVVRIAREHGATPAQVSLAWLADKPGVTAPIVGARTAKQLHETLGAATLHLDTAATTALDEVSTPQSGTYPYGAFGVGQRSRSLDMTGTQGVPQVTTKGSDAPLGRK